jgi:hypothetical protein
MVKYGHFIEARLFMKHARITTIMLCALFGTGCSYIIDNQARKAGDHLSASLMNFEDPQTVAEAMPTLLILADSVASGDNASPYSMLAAAKMYGSYSSAFAGSDKDRQKTLTRKGLEYIRLGSCKAKKTWCDVDTMNAAEFTAFIDTLTQKDVEIVYAYASALLSYIDAHNDDWGVIADLSKATKLLEFVIKHDEGYDNAGAHLFLGAISTTLPPTMGGKPEIGKAHFERAIELTDGRNLLIKVEYARRYARMMFDKDLHHQLLEEVLKASPKEEGLTLMNSWAQQEAKKLLDDESYYFD